MTVQEFKDVVHQKELFTKNDLLIVAVSGGLDSTVLCDLLYRSGFDFYIAHCNFKLRGAESDRDENFVKQLAEKYKVPFFVKQFDTNVFAVSNKISIQQAARKLRYEWFEEVRKEITDQSKEKDAVGRKKSPPNKRCFILTAHQLDDDIETMVFHFFQGSGISGLRGIPRKRDSIIRPLMDFSRKEIEQYAKENSITWVEDSSNSSTKYTRNFIRHELIPLAGKIITGIEQNLAANIQRFKESEKIYQQAIDQYRKKLLFRKDEEWMIPVEKLRLSDPVRTILFELISPFGFSAGQLNDAIGLMDSETGRWISSGTHRLLRNRKWLVISALKDEHFHDRVIEAGDEHIEFSGGMLNISRLKHIHNLDQDSSTVFVDEKDIKYPLILRKWKTGDYFYPLGMTKKKKLSRFFIDLKLSKNQKEKILVIESDKRIVWVVGYRIDNRFKITGGSESILQFELLNSGE
ncbi:tRNA lysidine(34) synthetase TilS [Pollutibacter soli]|uniref:tRNA lysidine(34) synthetase TilS n=1 Tax=Pollutibacter soli TaxID=3034157 RepID=UPI003013786E